MMTSTNRGLSAGEDKQKAVNHLRELKLERIQIELPQIAVTGNQSVGKSTVMSALLGIEFPTGSKLTTRCATQVTMREAPVVRVTIGISGQEATTVLHSLDEVADAIQRTTDELVPDSEHGAIEVDRYITIVVEGPNSPCLTLIDLPGIIQTVDEGQDPALISGIKVSVPPAARYSSRGRAGGAARRPLRRGRCSGGGPARPPSRLRCASQKPPSSLFASHAHVHDPLVCFVRA
jgi:interferon-induced GTP-binding protein Mx1